MSVTADTVGTAPFLGLRYFDEEHAHLFFGRDLQISDILEKLRRSRLVTVMGSSGSGKSSLVRAGVLPRLKAGLLTEAGPRWRTVKMRPGSSPIATLARELEKALAADGLEVTLRRGPLGLVQAVEECRLGPEENVLIVADQFEEIFRYQRASSQPEQAREEAAAFVKLLLEAAGQRARAIYVIVTMRSDYLGSCVQFRDLPERINAGLYLVPRMRRDQLEDAIAGPVAVEDAAIAPRLLQRLLNETGDDPDQLPVLQHALLRAWNAWNHAERPLDTQDLDGIGGMKDGLSRHAEEVFSALSMDQQRIARVIFQQLSECDAEGREIRRPAPVAEIAAVAGVTETEVNTVAEAFAGRDASFLYRNEHAHLDITHESLIRQWIRMQGARVGTGEEKGWLQEETEARDEYLLLVERAAKGDTLMGRALDDASAWRKLGLNAAWATRYTQSGNAKAFDDVVSFVDECQSMSAAQGRRRRWWRTGGIGLAIAIAVLALMWRATAQQRAVTQVALAGSMTQAAARLIADEHPQEALAYLARALRLAPDDLPARSWLADLVRQARDGALPVSGPTFTHGSYILDVAFSPDGRRLVTAGQDGTARVWDLAAGGAIGSPMRHSGSVHSARFSPDGRLIVTASDDGTAHLWEAVTGKPVGEAMRHQGAVAMAAFSPDGHRILTASEDNTAGVWEASTSQLIGSLEHTDVLTSAAFSPNGRVIVTASSDGTAQMWDAETRKPFLKPLKLEDGDTQRVIFSPSGRILAQSDWEARTWNANTGQPVGATLNHVAAAAFGPDGRQMVVSSSDNRVRVRDADTGEALGLPIYDEALAVSVAFSTDGRHIAMASGDTARVFEVGAAGPVLTTKMQHDRSIVSLAFSPDDRRILTAGSEGSARLWDAFTGTPVGRAIASEEKVREARFSPDGRLVLTLSEGKTARLWDAETGLLSGLPLEHPANVRSANFNPDGHLIVTASDDHLVRVWDTATRREVSPSLPHADQVASAVFTPDGQRVLTVEGDPHRAGGIVGRAWDANTHQRVGVPLRFELDHVGMLSPDGRRLVGWGGPEGPIWNTETGRPLAKLWGFLRPHFSPDGQRILTVGLGDQARLWDTDTGQPVGSTMRLGQTEPLQVAFSPDGSRVVVGGYGGKSARIWDARSGEPLGFPLKHDGDISAAAFSHDGRRLATASGRAARLWDVILPFDSAGDSSLLADLAEILGGRWMNESGSVIPLTMHERLERIDRLTQSDTKEYVGFDVLLRQLRPSSH